MLAEAFLPGVPASHVLHRLEMAGGNEVASGKLVHPESSAALAVNAFGWFIERPAAFPPLPGCAHAGAAEQVEVEYCARFPWAAGRHPWLDAAIMTASHLIGVESKRFEPFRDAKMVSFSNSYRRPVWGEHMQRYGAMRDALSSGAIRFEHLDAAQLVKHAYGLVTEGPRVSRRPILSYLFAEPATRGDVVIPSDAHVRHRDEIARFAAAVAGDEVEFVAASYREWLNHWPEGTVLIEHKNQLCRVFQI
ncbi:hypothetical protein [Sphingomonas sp. RB1R13]|uniref:hypothetical protein n=1 Tax=Sphingomonas sp. RB1R13 TaxID=3096159 RepID=UPI002FC90F75